MKLQGINRAFVKQGLKLINKKNALEGNNLGISALLGVAGIRGRVSEYSLGFAIGPRINAGGRVGESGLGSRLLRSNNLVEANEIAEKLNGYNKQRQAIEKGITQEATQMAEAQVASGRGFIFVYGKDWHQGIIGIIASRLKDKFNLPVAVGNMFEKDGTQIIKASSRSIKGVDIGNRITQANSQDLLIEGGGHAQVSWFFSRFS